MRAAIDDRLGDELAVVRRPDPPAIVLGEIRTGLLQNSSTISTAATREILAVIPQTLVRTRERPIRHATSPTLITGVDALLPGDGRDVRGVGTVATELSITGGRVQQSSSLASVIRPAAERRLPWSHYLTRPGVIEAWPRLDAARVAEGFLRGGSGRRGVLDVASICDRALGDLRDAAGLDGSPPFRIARTTLRWAGIVADVETSARLTLESETLRTLEVTGPPAVVDRLSELCRDLALHDWLLSSLLAMLDLARLGDDDRAVALRRVAPAIDHLVHLWMPAAHLPAEVVPLWTELERRTGQARQWETAVRRIRDGLSLATLERPPPGSSAG